MNRIRTVIGLLAGFCTLIVADGAAAQNRLDRQQIITSLYATEGTVGRLDPAALERAAAAAAARGGADAAEPLSVELQKFPQLSVEINFDVGSARIRPESYREVGLIADAFHTPYLIGQKFVVIGHTDSSGGREMNLKLSQQRARAVVEALSTTFHVPAAELFSIGLGEEQLQDPVHPTSGVNRRVQIINLGN